MSRRKKVIGKCKICGIEAQLSYEHVPPESAFNNQKHFYEIEFEKLANSADNFLDIPLSDLHEMRLAKKKQGGIGFYSLCNKCNNNTGSWYGHDFVSWARQGMSILLKSKRRPTLYYPTLFYPLRTIKQIITMFFSVNPDAFREEEAELVNFVLDKERRFVSNKYRIYCYYNIEGSKRYIGYSVVGKIDTGEINRLTEITFPPFGFVLSIDSGPPDPRLTDITHFANFSYNDWTDHYQRFITLPTFLPNSPGDYRSKEEITKGIIESKEYVARHVSANSGRL